MAELKTGDLDQLKSDNVLHGIGCVVAIKRVFYTTHLSSRGNTLKQHIFMREIGLSVAFISQGNTLGQQIGATH